MPFGHMVSDGEESSGRKEPKTLKITESDKSSVLFFFFFFFKVKESRIQVRS